MIVSFSFSVASSSSSMCVCESRIGAHRTHINIKFISHGHNTRWFIQIQTLQWNILLLTHFIASEIMTDMSA